MRDNFVTEPFTGSNKLILSTKAGWPRETTPTYGGKVYALLGTQFQKVAQGNLGI